MTHHDDVDEQRQTKAEVFADEKLAAPDGLGKNRIDGSPLNLFVDKADADEDGDERAEHEHRAQSHINDDLGFLRRRQFAQKYRADD